MSSDDVTAPQPPRGPSFRNIKSFLRGLYLDLLLVVAFVSLFIPWSVGAGAQGLLEGVKFGFGMLVLLMVYFWWFILPLLAAPLVVGLARDYRRAALLDGGD